MDQSGSNFNFEDEKVIEEIACVLIQIAQDSCQVIGDDILLVQDYD